MNRLSGVCPWLGESVLGQPGEPVCTSAGKSLSSLRAPLQPLDDSPHRPTQTHRQLASTRPPPLRHPSAGRRAGFLLVKLLSGSLHVHFPCSVLIIHLPWKGWGNTCVRSQGPPRRGDMALNRIKHVKDETYAFSPPLIWFNFHRFFLCVLGGGHNVFLFPDCFWMT